MNIAYCMCCLLLLSMSWSFSLSFCLGFCIEKSQLEAMQANHLHANTMAHGPVHLKGREEKEVHSHPRARRVSSDENSRTKVVGPECHISTIPELTECLEKRLRFNNQKVRDQIISCHIQQTKKVLKKYLKMSQYHCIQFKYQTSISC